MENVIITLACLAIIILAGSSYAICSLDSLDTIAGSLKETEYLIRELNNTDIKLVSATVKDGGTTLEAIVLNEGNTTLRQFDRWDLIVKRQNQSGEWVPYSPGTPGWSIDGIYHNGNPETLEPNILNPEETLVITSRLMVPVAQGTSNRISITTANGAGTQIAFSW